MAHSYTPGLKVLQRTLFKKERILPLKGKVLVKKGDKLSPDTIVASTNLPGNVQMLKVNNILNIEPRDVVDCLIVKEGDSVKVKVIGFDDRGKVKLSMKRVNQETGEKIEEKKED